MKKVKDEARLLSVEGASKYTSLSYGTIRNAILAGALPAFRLASPRADGKMIKRILIERADLDQWIDRSKERY